MDPVRFDSLSKSLSTIGTRRGLVRVLLGMPLAGSLAVLLEVGEADARLPLDRVRGRKAHKQEKRHRRTAGNGNRGNGNGGKGGGKGGKKGDGEGDGDNDGTGTTGGGGSGGPGDPCAGVSCGACLKCVGGACVADTTPCNNVGGMCLSNGTCLTACQQDPDLGHANICPLGGCGCDSGSGIVPYCGSGVGAGGTCDSSSLGGCPPGEFCGEFGQCLKACTG